MNVTITTNPINNGKQHIVKIPFVGTFTVDQKDVNKAVDFALSRNKRETAFFLQSLAIDCLQSQIAKREKEISLA
jgi:hypothetical protein